MDEDHQIDSNAILENVKTRLGVYLTPRMSPSDFQIQFPCNLCFQFIEIGMGILYANGMYIVWEGNCIGDNELKSYQWSWRIVTQMHSKEDLDSINQRDSILLITLDETLFVQFKISCNVGESCIHQLQELQRNFINQKHFTLNDSKIQDNDNEWITSFEYELILLIKY